MYHRNVGNSALKVSEISLGSWLNIGGRNVDDRIPGSPAVGERELGFKILEKAVDTGITFFDTAPGYGKGNAERMLGEFFKDYNRDNFVLATKVFFPIDWDDNRLGLSKKSIHTNLKDSLERLQTDFIDIYYCHFYDNQGNLEETIRAMNHMIDQGKILYWGVSNWEAFEIERAYGICKSEGLKPPIILQTKYNLMHRDIELSHESTIDYTNIGVVAYSPLEEGILTGKYNNEKFENTRFEKVKGTFFEESYGDYKAKMFTQENLEKLKKIEELAKEQEISMAQLSLAWVLKKNYVNSALIGASKIEHVTSNVETTKLKLESDVFVRMEEIMNNEPKYIGDHGRWTYHNIKRMMKESNYRYPSVAQRRREEFKKQEEAKKE